MDGSCEAVIAAAASGDESALKAVIRVAKGDPSCQDDNGFSPLMAAAAAGHGMIVSLLLQVILSMRAHARVPRGTLDISGRHRGLLTC